MLQTCPSNYMQQPGSQKLKEQLISRQLTSLTKFMYGIGTVYPHDVMVEFILQTVVLPNKTIIGMDITTHKGPVLSPCFSTDGRRARHIQQAHL